MIFGIKSNSLHKKFNHSKETLQLERNCRDPQQFRTLCIITARYCVPNDEDAIVAGGAHDSATHARRMKLVRFTLPRLPRRSTREADGPCQLISERDMQPIIPTWSLQIPPH